jgi:hypothetical protein
VHEKTYRLRTIRLAYVAQALRFETFKQLGALKGLSITVNALAAVGDVLIAAVLCIVLHRSRTGFHRSDTMINKLIVFAVNTGLLTSICAVASLISIVVAGNTFLYICFYFSLGRLYSNSLLATLNARNMIRAAADNTENLSLSMQSLGVSKVSSLIFSSLPRKPISVEKPNTVVEASADQYQNHQHGRIC